MTTRLTIVDFLRAGLELRTEWAAWLERVEPDYWTRTVELLADGRVRVLSIRKANAHLIERVYWGDHGRDLVTVARYTTAEPPLSMLRYLRYVA
jgi:hypothetical protein